jgi:hypothetical protein
VSQFVLNEWFWADLRGDNGVDKQTATLLFLHRFAASIHQIVITVETPFDAKAWKLCNDAPGIGRAFVLLVRQNSERCVILQPGDLPEFPHALETTVNPDDRYVVQTCLAAPGSTLITTDAKLAEHLKRFGIRCMTREQALSSI